MMDFQVRQLEEKDLKKGFLETLSHLREVGDLDEKQIKNIFMKIKSDPNNKIFVAVDTKGKIIGATTLIVEQKFIHKGGVVGHIEDVVAHKDFRKMGIGSALIEKALEVAKSEGCYKVILNCLEGNIPFYEKLGFKKRGVEMRIDLKW